MDPNNAFGDDDNLSPSIQPFDAPQKVAAQQLSSKGTTCTAHGLRQKGNKYEQDEGEMIAVDGYYTGQEAQLYQKPRPKVRLVATSFRLNQFYLQFPYTVSNITSLLWDEESLHHQLLGSRYL